MAPQRTTSTDADVDTLRSLVPDFTTYSDEHIAQSIQIYLDALEKAGKVQCSRLAEKELAKEKRLQEIVAARAKEVDAIDAETLKVYEEIDQMWKSVVATTGRPSQAAQFKEAIDNKWNQKAIRGLEPQGHTVEPLTHTKFSSDDKKPYERAPYAKKKKVAKICGGGGHHDVVPDHQDVGSSSGC